MVEAVGPALGCFIKTWMHADIYDAVPVPCRHVEPWLTQEITGDIGKWAILPQASSNPDLRQIWVCSLVFPVSIAR